MTVRQHRRKHPCDRYLVGSKRLGTDGQPDATGQDQ